MYMSFYLPFPVAPLEVFFNVPVLLMAVKMIDDVNKKYQSF